MGKKRKGVGSVFEVVMSERELRPRGVSVFSSVFDVSRRKR